jgi:transcriptional regulator with XRE-family HTH domain
MTFGERLRALRKEKGYTQGELAEKIGINNNILSKYETDKVQPTLERIEWICSALNVSATELLGF